MPNQAANSRLRAMTGEPQIRIDVSRSADDFDRLRADWERLSDADPFASVFASWTWQSAWWRQYGNSIGSSRQLCILVATLSNTGEIVGVLPTYLSESRMLRSIPVRTLAMVGTGADTSPDYLNPVILPGYEVVVCREFAEAIVGLPWSVLEMHDLGSAACFRDALVAALRSAGVHCQTGNSAEISWIELPDDWTGYLSSLSSNRRYQIRSQRRKFNASGQTRFYVWQDADNLDSAVDALVDLHLQRWQTRTDEHAFASPEYIGFHRSVMHGLFEKGQLRLYCLELDDELVAMLYCYRWKNGIYYFQGGFNPDYEKLRVGNVVMAYAVENAINEKNRVFNMLKGDYRYKKSLAKNNDTTSYVKASRNTVAGFAHRLRYESLPELKKRLVRGRA